MMAPIEQLCLIAADSANANCMHALPGCPVKCDGEKRMDDERLRSCLQRRWPIVPRTSPPKSDTFHYCALSAQWGSSPRIPIQAQACGWAHVVAGNGHNRV